MHLADYILENIDPLLGEWEKFARTIGVVTSEMNQEQLRDHAAKMLVHIAHDMQGKQTEPERQAKSEGRRVLLTSAPPQSVSEYHARDRQASGFTLMEMVSEYRALRASVIRLWTSHMGEVIDREALDQLTRFNEAIDELQTDSIEHFTNSLDQSRDLLLAVLGHDLRDPLSVIVTYATVLERLDLGSHARPAVERLLGTATRMKFMVRDLLDFATARLGQELNIMRSPMDMTEACRRTADEIETFHPGSTFRIQTEGNVPGEWDRTRISQMLSNLFGNAAQHGSPGTPIDVLLGGDEKEVSIAIHNEGEPIPPSELKKIFEPMVRGSRQNATPLSVGLGLFIASAVARAHKGTISVESSAAAGTTFTVVLPRVAPSLAHPLPG